MKYKYIGRHWPRIASIERVEIVRDTHCFIILTNGRRRSKMAVDSEIFDTFEEAQGWVLRRATIAIERTQELLHQQIRNHDKIAFMTDSWTEHDEN